MTGNTISLSPTALTFGLVWPAVLLAGCNENMSKGSKSQGIGEWWDVKDARPRQADLRLATNQDPDDLKWRPSRLLVGRASLWAALNRRDVQRLMSKGTAAHGQVWWVSLKVDGEGKRSSGSGAAAVNLSFSFRTPSTERRVCGRSYRPPMALTSVASHLFLGLLL